VIKNLGIRTQLSFNIRAKEKSDFLELTSTGARDINVMIARLFEGICPKDNVKETRIFNTVIFTH